MREYHGEVSTSAHFQVSSIGECLPAVMSEAITRVATVRTASDEQMPRDVNDDVQAIKSDTNKSE